MILEAVVALALAACPVEVQFTLHSYTGPIVIDNACLVSNTYTGNMLVVEARDMGDGIFKDGFDGDN